MDKDLLDAQLKQAEEDEARALAKWQTAVGKADRLRTKYLEALGRAHRLEREIERWRDEHADAG